MLQEQMPSEQDGRWGLSASPKEQSSGEGNTDTIKRHASPLFIHPASVLMFWLA